LEEQYVANSIVARDYLPRRVVDDQYVLKTVFGNQQVGDGDRENNRDGDRPVESGGASPTTSPIVVDHSTMVASTPAATTAGTEMAFAYDDARISLRLTGLKREANGDVTVSLAMTNLLPAPEWFGVCYEPSKHYLVDDTGTKAELVLTSLANKERCQLFPSGHEVSWWVRFGKLDSRAQSIQVYMQLAWTWPTCAFKDCIDVMFLDVPVGYSERQ
jgi:hypothetical protein